MDEVNTERLSSHPAAEEKSKVVKEAQRSTESCLGYQVDIVVKGELYLLSNSQFPHL